MERRKFIFNLAGAIGISTVVTKSIVAAEPVAAQKFVYEGYFKGVNHYKGLKLLRRLPTGSPILLRREPTNPYDTNAIELLSGNTKIGYLSRYDNVVLANLLDAGVTLVAFTQDNSQVKKDDFYTFSFEVYLG